MVTAKARPFINGGPDAMVALTQSVPIIGFHPFYGSKDIVLVQPTPALTGET